MEELDDILIHYGVKGMRWGVNRDRNRPGGADGRPDASDRKKYTNSDRIRDKKEINRKVRNKELTKKQGMQARKDNVHKSLMNNKAYQKRYEKSVKKGVSENKARVRAANAYKTSTDFKMAAAVGTISVGASLVKASSLIIGNPEAVRIGKNIVLAAKRSNLRYPSPSDIRNVVN